MSSPSQVFAWIGQNMALGLGAGFSGQFREIERNINRVIRGMTAEASMSVSNPRFALAGAGAAESPISIVVQANVNNNMDMEVLARTLVKKIERARGR